MSGAAGFGFLDLEFISPLMSRAPLLA